MPVRDEAAKLAGEIAELRHAIHREPEIGLDLPKTQAKVLDALDGLPLEISTGRALSSVTAVLRGGARSRRPGPVVLLRGDMDALPVTEETGLPYASAVPGAMHACGHDLHTAMLAGAARLLSARQADLPGTVIFMFQPGEEGYAGARHMISEGVLDAAGQRPVAAYALHVTSNKLPCGMFSTRPGPMLAAADQITVTVHGRGGHASQPHRAADPIPAACEMVLALQTHGDQEVRRVRPRRHHGRQLPRRHHRQRDPRPGQVPGHRPLLQRRVPDRAGGAGAAADQGHRRRARADRRRRIRGRVPGHRQRRGRGGVRAADDRRRVRAGPGRDGRSSPSPAPRTSPSSWTRYPARSSSSGRARRTATRRARPPTTPRWRSSTTRRWPRAPPSTPS